MKIVVLYLVVSIALTLLIRIGIRYIDSLKRRKRQNRTPLFKALIKAPLTPIVIVLVVALALTVEREAWSKKCKEIIGLISIE